MLRPPEDTENLTPGRDEQEPLDPTEEMSDPSADERSFEAVIVAFLKAEDAGLNPTPSEFISLYPRHADALRSYFRDVVGFARDAELLKPASTGLKAPSLSEFTTDWENPDAAEPTEADAPQPAEPTEQTEADRTRSLSIPPTQSMGRGVGELTTEFGDRTESFGTAETWDSPPKPRAGVEKSTKQDPDLHRGKILKYFGDYELIKELGRGGMGVVYQARQISLNRLVALKLLKSGQFAASDELARFRNEALAVAHLEHPGILPILEVGEHDDRHYFSMPLMGGGSLAARLPEYRENPKAAARIMIEIAEAVHHAHQRGLLHRDLKPANILLDDEGRPRVTDFGLAKWIDQDSDLTNSGAILGTPAYMAPEQASGNKRAVTTASDVYGLGTILYALLTGSGPFSGSTPAETLRRVREETPKPLRSINGKIARGLETVCMKCLEKDPNRRYASAAALADDLRNWVEDMPIQARPTGPMLRLALWCKRRPAQASLGAALFLSMILGVLAFAWQYRETRRELATSTVINRFFSTVLFGREDPWGYLAQRNVTLEQALERAAANVDTRFVDFPSIEASERITIGNALHVLGRDDAAEPQLRRGLELYRKLPDTHHDVLIRGLTSLGLLLVASNRAEEARPYLDEAYRLNLEDWGPNHEDTVASSVNLGYLRMAENLLDEAEKILTEALKKYEAGPSIQPETLGLYETRDRLKLGEYQTTSMLGAVYQKQGRLPEAETMFRRTLQGRLALLGEGHPRVLNARNDLLANLIMQRDNTVALPLLIEAVEASRKAQGDKHEATLTLLINLGSCRFELRQLDEAEKAFREAIERLKPTHSDAHPLMRSALTDLGKVEEFKGRNVEAEGYFRRVLNAVARPQGQGTIDSARAQERLAEFLHNVGRYPEAVELLEDALPVYRREMVPQSLERLAVEATYGSTLLELGRAAEAEPILLAVRDQRRALLPVDDWQRANAEALHGGALLALNRPGEAEPELKAAYEILKTSKQALPVYVEKARRRLEQVNSSLGRPGASNSRPRGR